MLEYWDRMQPERSLALLSAKQGGRTNEVNVSDKLRELAGILADWIEPAPDVPEIYLFGSRVRGGARTRGCERAVPPRFAGLLLRLCCR